MPEIEPKMTKARLNALSGSYLQDGRHRSESLPGIISDARKVEQDNPPVTDAFGEPDLQAYKNNRKLAELIQQALKDAKTGNEGSSSWHGAFTPMPIIRAGKGKSHTLAAAAAPPTKAPEILTSAPGCARMLTHAMRSTGRLTCCLVAEGPQST